MLRIEESVLRMHNVGIVVEDIKAVIAFFAELGMELEGEAKVEGKWVDRVVGLDGVRNDIAMMRTPDGHSRIELIKFRNPAATGAEPSKEPVNMRGIRRIMFSVNNIEDVLSRLRAHGAELIGEVVQYEDMYLLCYVRGPEGIIIALAEQLNQRNPETGSQAPESGSQAPETGSQAPES
jgi:catechol 2,3-dioxygenase-like lactoylglutathione lyase family enzyme